MFRDRERKKVTAKIREQWVERVGSMYLINKWGSEEGGLVMAGT